MDTTAIIAVAAEEKEEEVEDRTAICID